MKMILLITNKEDITVDFIVHKLKLRGYDYYRLNTEDIPEIINIRFSISDHKYELYDQIKKCSIDLNAVSAVYFRRPKISTLEYISKIDNYERQYLRNELSFLIEGIYKTLRHAFWVNNVYKIREAENKILQLQIAQEVGFAIPYSVISNSVDDIQAVLKGYSGNCITKPIKSGNMGLSDDSKVIFTSEIDNACLKDPERIKSFPLYIQEKVNKGYDIRCIVVGEKTFAAKIDSQESVDGKTDWRKTSDFLPHDRIDLPYEIHKKAILITQRLGLTYSAIDFVLDKNGKYVFLECNPNGQWAWIEKRLGYPISDSIVDALQEGG